jgi:hypothetical protein
MSDIIDNDNVNEDVVPIESPIVSTDLTTCPNSGPCLLCISDLEGCQLKSSPPIVVDQHTHFCSSKFFDALTTAMTDNPEMQIVFLGDYFDQGPHMINSIKGIAKLHTTIATINENNPDKYILKDRVHIILGNRDVNKMRIPLEVSLNNDEFVNVEWAGKKLDVNDTFIKGTSIQRTKEMLPKTYGFQNSFITQLSTELTDSEDKTLDYFNSIFNEPTLKNDTSEYEFAKAIKLLFTEGKLIKTITIEDTEKSITSTFLAAHAGTIHTCVFDATALSEIMNKPVDLKKKYFELIEEFRKRLIFNNDEVQADIVSAIKFYDNLLSAVVTSVFETGIVKAYNDDDEFKKKYSLLQAFGLSAPGSVFRSPIQSCGLGSGCGTFIYPKSDFVELLKNKGIKGCIHGHIPFCGTVPLIFKTPDENGIVEIACDTSNGNRPANHEKANNENDPVTLNQVPLAIVYPTGAGITSIDIDGKFSKSTTLGLSNDGKDTRYQGMIDFFKFENNSTFPKLDSQKNEIIYPKGTFLFIKVNGNPFPPAVFGDDTVRQQQQEAAVKATEEALAITKAKAEAEAKAKAEAEAKAKAEAAAVEAAGGKRKTRRHKITKNKNKRNKKGKTLRNKRRTIRKR